MLLAGMSCSLSTWPGPQNGAVHNVRPFGSSALAFSIKSSRSQRLKRMTPAMKGSTSSSDSCLSSHIHWVPTHIWQAGQRPDLADLVIQVCLSHPKLYKNLHPHTQRHAQLLNHPPIDAGPGTEVTTSGVGTSEICLTCLKYVEVLMEYTPEFQGCLCAWNRCTMLHCSDGGHKYQGGSGLKKDWIRKDRALAIAVKVYIRVRPGKAAEGFKDQHYLYQSD